MTTAERTEQPAWKVVVNLDGQYSLWPADRDNPAGWQDDGTSGSRETCLAHIADVWTDMRPLRLRGEMDSEPIWVGVCPRNPR